MNLRSARKIFLRSPATFRPMVRWIWNDYLDSDRLSKQMDQLLDMGMGGALIRPGAGLPPGAYLGDAWFESVMAVARRARRRRASLWIAEDFAAPTTRAVITGILRDAPEHTAQMLEMEDLAPGVAPKPVVAGSEIVAAFEITREVLDRDVRHPVELRKISSDGIASTASRRIVFRTVLLPDRLRLFEPSATLELLARTHQRYHTNAKKYFGNTIGLCLMLGAGVPHAPGMVPWDSELSALFHETHGYAIEPSLPALFFDLPGCEAVRSDFWGLIDEMLREGFDEPFGRWCAEREMPHACALPEAGCLDHAAARGGRAMMRHAAHQFPALITESGLVDDACSRTARIEARSVKRQLGLEGVAEIALVDTPCMTRIAQGTSFLAARTTLASLRGDRKEAYTGIIVASDNDEHTRAETDAESRFAWMLGQGHAVVHTLLLHPYTSLQAAYRARAAGDAAPSPMHDAIVRHFDGITRALTDASIEFDYADEALLAKNGTATQRTLKVGSAEYRAVVLPPLLNLRSSTLELLHDFAMGGGLVIAVGSLAELLDGRGSDRVLRFFEEYGERIVQGVDFGRYRALIERLRRANLNTRLYSVDSRGNEDHTVFERRVWDEIEMIGLHNAGNALTQVALSYPAIMTGHTESWDPVTGTTRALGPVTSGEPLSQSLNLAASAAALVVTTPEPPDDVQIDATVEESRMIPAWSAHRAEPNIAVLRECRPIDNNAPGEWTSPAATRAVLAKRLAQGRGPVSFRVQWRLRVELDSPMVAKCSLAAELDEGASVSVDGADIPVEHGEWRLDPSIRLTELPALSPGEHIIEVWRQYSVAGEFQPPWVQGPFANISGPDDQVRIAAARDTFALADLPKQSLGAYFGPLIYTARVDAFVLGTTKRIKLQAVGLENPVEVRFDGSRAGFILPPQGSCDLSDVWRPGARTIEVVFRVPPDGLLSALHCAGPNGRTTPHPNFPAPQLAVFTTQAGKSG